MKQFITNWSRGSGGTDTSLNWLSQTPTGSRKLLGFLFMALLFSLPARSQVATYNYAVSAGTYSEITGGTVVSTLTWDSNVSTLQTINSFTYNGTAVTTMSISANGWISIGGTAASISIGTTTALSTAVTATGAAGVICPLGADLANNSVGVVRWQYLAGSNETVIQWKNVQFWSGGGDLNFQIRLNHTNNSISFVYGTMNRGTFTGTTSPVVGIKNGVAAGAIGTTMLNLTLKNIPAGLSCLNWNNAVRGRLNTEAMLFSSSSPVSTLTSGTTFTFTPQTGATGTWVNPVTTFSATSGWGITSSAATPTWTAPTNATRYNVQYRRAADCNWTNFTGNPVSAASAALTGLTDATTYHLRVQPFNNTSGNTAGYSHIANGNATANSDGYVAAGTFTTLALPATVTSYTANGVASNPLCAAGGQTITINGTSFTAGSTVSIGGVAATGVTVVSATQITCTTPALATGGNITVTNTSGTPSATAVGNAYTVSANPIVSLSPSNSVAPCGSYPLPVTASNTATALTTTYAWSNSGTLSASTGATVNVLTTTNQSYVVNATDQYGCTGTATLTATPTAPPAVTVSASSTSFCGSGGTTTLTPSSANANYTFTYSVADGTGSVNPLTGASTDLTLSSTSAVKTRAVDNVSQCATDVFTSIGVYPLPAATMSVTNGDGQCPGTALTVNSGLSAGNFSVGSTTYNWRTAPSTAVTVCSNGVANTAAGFSATANNSLDDGGWAGIPIGFTYNFFGSTFTSIAAGTNGLLMLGTVPGYTTTAGNLGQYSFNSNPTTCAPPGVNGTVFPNCNNPGNIIALMAMDNYFGSGTAGSASSTLKYWTTGYAPNRVFVIEYTDVDACCSNLTTGWSAQCQLYETTGNIEIHIQYKSNTSSATVGLQDATKTIGAVAPGRQTFTTTIATPEAWRFSPPANLNTVWTKTISGGSSTAAGGGSNVFTINTNDGPNPFTATYQVQYTNPINGCSATNSVNYISATAISNVSISPAAPVCVGTQLTATPTGGNTPYTYLWQVGVTNLGTANTQATATSGTYKAIVTDACGFSISKNRVVSPSPVFTVNTPASFCGVGGSRVLNVTSAPNADLTYAWTAITPTATISNVQPDQVTATVTESSDFQVVATSIANGCTTTLNQSVGVFQMPSASLSHTPAGPRCPGTPITVASGLSSGNFSSAVIPFVSIGSTTGGTPTVLVDGGVAVVAQTSGGLDDGGWGGIALPFTFKFFGVPYTTCNIGTNGTILFGTYNATYMGDYTFTSLPNTSEPLGMVAVCANDNQLGTSGTIRYWTEGTAPNRRFVVQYLNVPHLSSGASTARAIFYETTGVIDVQVNGSTNATANKVIGINGPDGTIGVQAFTSTAAFSNTAYRFTPPANYTTVWTQGATTLSTGTNLFTLNQSPAGDATYTLTYTNVNNGCSSSSNYSYTAATPISAVAVTPDPATTPSPCSNIALGATVTGGLTPYTYAWTGPTGSLGTSATPLPSQGTGQYSVTVTDACSTTGTSSANYTVIPAPGAPTAQVATSVLSNLTGFTANWSAASGSPTGYSLDVATDAAFTSFAPGYNNLNVGNVLSYNITGLTPSTTYYYRVQANLGVCNSVYSNTITQFTGLCTPTISLGCTDGDVIAQVVLNTLSNNSGTGCPSGNGYNDYTTTPGLTTTLMPGTLYSCIVWAGQFGENYTAWIDYNDNLVFEANERIGYTSATVAGSGAVGVLGSNAEFPVFISCNPPAGNHIMRVMCQYGVTSGLAIQPCASFSFGEAEDYMITIAPAPACPTPNLLVYTNNQPYVSSVSYQTAKVFWYPGCSPTNPAVDVTYGPNGFDPNQATGTLVSNATVVDSIFNQGLANQFTTRTYRMNNLVPGTTYDVYVRSRCSSSNFSAWSIAATFTTLPCPTISGLTVSATTSNSAQLSWGAGPSITNGYNIQYQVSGASTWTNFTGNPLTSTSLVLTGLNPSTSYLYRVQGTCPASTVASPSNTFPFTTSCVTFAAPLTQNFNTGVTVPGLPACWSKLVSGLTGSANVVSTTAGLPVSGNQVVMTNGSNSNAAGNVILVSPQLTDIANVAAPNRLTFSARATTTVGATSTANPCTAGAGGQYPTGAAIVPAGNTVTTITTCNYTSEYALVSLTADSAYQIIIQDASLVNKWMTITTDAATPVVRQTGQSPQTFIAPATGTFRLYWSDNLAPTCGSTSTCHTTTIQKVAVPAAQNTTSTVLVGTLTDPADASTFTQVGAAVNISGTHTVYNVDFIGASGSYVGIKHGESTAGTNKSIYIDNIGWAAIPTCPNPAGLSVTGITIGSATFNWTALAEATNGYSLQYRISGDPTWTSVSVPAGTTSYTVSTLDPGTIYEWQLGATCAADISIYTPGTSFSTLCVTADVPYAEGFEDVNATNQLPNCLSTTNLGTRTFTYNAPVTGGASRTGNGYAVIVSNNTAPGDFIFTKAINLSAGTTYQLRFWYRRGDAFTSATNTLTAWYGTTASSVAMTNAIGTAVNLNLATTGQYTSFVQTFTPATTGVYFVGIRRTAGTPATGVVSIDDISLDVPSTCPDPSGLAASGSATSSTLGINWSENGTATQWDIEYGASPYTFTGVPNVVGTSSRPYTITALQANTAYSIRVRSRCSATNLSDWSVPVTLTTACGVVTSFPWSYGFEDVTAVNVLPNCHAAYPASLSQTLGLSVYPNVAAVTGTSYNRVPRTGNAFASFYRDMGSNTDSTMYFTPTFQLTAGTTYRFAMYYRKGGLGPWPRLACYYGTSQSVTGMLPIPGARVSIPTSNSSYSLLEGYFIPATSGNYNIAIASASNVAPFYLSFDDLSLSVVPCQPPSAFATTAGTDNVTWSATNPVSGSVPVNYQIEWNTTGVFTGTPNVTLTPTNTLLGAVNTTSTTGLTASTRYYYQYRSNCGGNQASWTSGSFITKPANDDCAAAVTLTPSTTIACTNSVSGSTLGATASLGTTLNTSTQCTITQSNPDDDVWYKFVATSIQHAISLANSSGFDGVLEVRGSAAGACPGTSPAIGCSNQSTEGGIESVTLNNLVVGNTYYIRVWSATTNAQTTTPVNNLPITNTFSICVATPSLGGPGSTCNNPLLASIFDSPWYTSNTTQGAGDDIGIQASCNNNGNYGGGEDIIYRVNVFTSGVRTIKVTNLNGTANIGWFLKSSSDCDNTLATTTLACATSGSGDAASGYYNLTPGTYFLVIDYNATAGPTYSNYRLDITKVPGNDEVAGAIQITPSVSCTAPVTGTVDNATPTADVPTSVSCTGTPDDDVWYRFTATSTNHLITMTGNTFVDRISAFSQVLVNTTLELNLLGCSSANAGVATLNLSGLTVGTTYYLRVYSSTTGATPTAALNNFTLCIQTPPSNDDPCGATTLTAGAFASYQTGNNAVATNSASIAGSCANFGSNFTKDVWYKVQAPADGVLAVNILAGTYNDHDLQVWSTSNQGNPCAGTFTSVSCDLASGFGNEPYVYLTGLTAGNWYFLQVRSNAAGQGGTFQIAATNAVNWTGAVSTLYDSPGNWFGETLPPTSANVAIPATTNKPVLSYSVANPTGVSVANLFMANNAQLTLNLNVLYKVRNNINSGGTAYINGPGKLQFVLGNAQTITNTLCASNVELAKTAGTSVGFAAGSFLKVYDVFTPTSGAMNSNNNLVMASDEASTNATGPFNTSGQAAVGAGTVNGSVVVERFVKKQTNLPEYHYVSSPVSGGATVVANYADNLYITGDAGYAYTTDPFAPQPSQFPNAWWYNEALNSSNASIGWTSATGSVSADPGRGFALTFGSSTKLDVSGTLNTGNITRAISYTDNGFNLIGNPYPQPISWNSFSSFNSTSISPTVYLWSPGGNQYATYNPAGGGLWINNGLAGNNDKIAHSQGFFVVANSGATGVTFRNADRSTTNAYTFFTTPQNLIRLQLDNGGNSDESVIYFSEDATDGYDQVFDSRKLIPAMVNSPSLYSIAGDNMEMAINGLHKFNEDMVIPLGVIAGQNGKTTISATDLSKLDANIEVYLEDAVSGKVINLRNQAYTVNLSQGNAGSRFFLRFKNEAPASSAIVAAAQPGAFNIYGADNRVFVNIPADAKGEIRVEVMNVLGQQMTTEQVSNAGGLKEIEVANAIAGNYLVKVVNGGKVYTQKLFLGSK